MNIKDDAVDGWMYSLTVQQARSIATMEVLTASHTTISEESLRTI